MENIVNLRATMASRPIVPNLVRVMKDGGVRIATSNALACVALTAIQAMGTVFVRMGLLVISAM